MSVRRRKDTVSVVWQARWKNPQGKIQAKNFKTKAEAERFDAMMRADVMKGDYSSPQAGKTLVSEVYEKWVETQGHLKPKTREDYKSLWINNVEPIWGNRKLLSVTRAQYKTWVAMAENKSGNKVSSSRMRKAAVVLNLVLDHAVDMELITKNPLGKIKGTLPKVLPARNRTALELDELITLADNCGDYRTMILIAGFLGLRWGELAILSPDDLDFKTNTLIVNKSLSEVNGNFQVVTTKTGNQRTLPIPDFLLNDLKALSLATPAGKPLFSSPEGTFLRKSNFARRVFKPALLKTGLNNVTFHELRHTAISQQLNAGANILAVSKVAGHSSPSTTLRVYAHELTGTVESMRSTLDENLMNLSQSDQKNGTGFKTA